MLWANYFSNKAPLKTSSLRCWLIFIIPKGFPLKHLTTWALEKAITPGNLITRIQVRQVAGDNWWKGVSDLIQTAYHWVWNRHKFSWDYSRTQLCLKRESSRYFSTRSLFMCYIPPSKCTVIMLQIHNCNQLQAHRAACVLQESGSIKPSTHRLSGFSDSHWLS